MKETMKETLFKNLSLYARNFLSLQTLKLHRNNGNGIPFTSLSPSPPLKFRFLSSKADSFAANSNSVPETNSAQTQKQESSIEVDDVSNEELKRRIEKFFGGDEEAIPSIFEAILKRKLAGKHDESDDELMKEFRNKLAHDVSDEEFDSEEDEL